MPKFRLLPDTVKVKTPAHAVEVAGHLSTKRLLAVDTETTGLSRTRDRAIIASISSGPDRYCIFPEALPYFRDLLENPEIKLVFHNANFDSWMLLNVGIDLNRRSLRNHYRIYDTMVAHALMDSDAPHDLKYLAKQYLGIEMVPFRTVFAAQLRRRPLEQILLDPDNEAVVSNYAGLDAFATYHMFTYMRERLSRSATENAQYPTLWSYYVLTELPYTKILWSLERAGIQMDADELHRQAPILERDILAVQKWFGREMGRLYINLRSNDQMSDLFFNRLGYQPISYTDEGAPQLNKATLKVWARRGCRFASKLMEYRDLDKKFSTYTVGLLKQVHRDSRIHCSFNQATARTGRLSSSDPNLQNQPPYVRSAYIASPGCRLVAMDYCLHPSTRVLTTGLTWDAVENVSVGEELVGFDESLKGTRLRRSTVVAKERITRPCYELTMSNGVTLVCSSEHMWVVGRSGETWNRRLRSWVPTVDIRVGDRIGHYIDPWDTKQGRDVGYLLWEGRRTRGKHTSVVRVVSKRFLGNQEVIALETSTKTFIAEGFLSHNCQLEMRILAHMSGDPTLCDAIRNELDVHSSTAAMMFRVEYADIVKAREKDDRIGEAIKEAKMYGQDPPTEELTDQDRTLVGHRKVAKAINFGLMYGQGARALAATIGVSVDEARKLIDTYFRTLPMVSRYFNRAINQARETGYCVTILGRRRPVPNLHSRIYRDVAEAERKVKNTPIQGCYPARTRILTSAGAVPIGDAAVEGTAWTGTSWARYTKLDRGECQLADLTFDNGQTHTCDTRHQVLVEREMGYEFVHYTALRTGDRVCLSMAEPLEYGTSVDTTAYYWLGYAVGNGSTSPDSGHRNALSLTIGTHKGRYTQAEKSAELRAWITSHGFFAQYRQAPGKGCCTVTVENAAFRRAWEGLGYVWGAHAHTKRVPTSVWSASLAGRRAFLLGLLDADGTVGALDRGGAGGANLHMCQRELLEELQQLFRSCGVVGHLRGPYRPASGSTSWRLNLNGGQLLAHLGYGNFRKVSVRSPSPRFLVSRFLSALPTEHHYPNGSSEQVLVSRMRHGGTTSVYKLKELCGGLGIDIGPIYDTTVLVEKMERPEVEITYTLSVDDPTHRFDAEGVIAKNTAAEIVKLAMIKIWEDPLITASGVRMLLQVHDELVFEGPEAAIRDLEVNRRINHHMSHPFDTFDLIVPLDTSEKSGSTWYECK